MKTIFNTNVKISSEKQYNRLKKEILKKGLKMNTLDFSTTEINFHYNPLSKTFDAWLINCYKDTVSEKEFLELLKQHQCTE